MKLIIDIPKRIYDVIQIRNDMRSELHEAVRNGIPLPKGHGDLIDKDELLKIGRYSHTRSDIDSIPVIVEADKESKDETRN